MYIYVSVEAVRREGSTAREALVTHHSAESAARQSREVLLTAWMVRTSRDLDGLVMSATGFMSGFHAKKQEESGSIDSLIHDSMEPGLVGHAYPEARRKALIPAPIHILRSVCKRTYCGSFERGGIPLRIRTRNILRGSS